MKKALPWIGAIAALALVGGGAFWLGKSQAPQSQSGVAAAGNAKGSSGPGATAGPPPAVVEAASVTVSKLAQGITAVGSLRSDESVIIRPEVSGRVAEILFREGQPVKKGTALIRFDAGVQRAELQQAEANLSLSKSKAERAADLQKKGFLSSQARDEAESNYRVAQATYDLALAKLTKLEIKAPFSGTMGLRQVSVGDYIRDGQDIANLEAIDPLKVDFRVPEIFMKQVSSGQALQVSLDGFPNKTFDGKVLAINPLVDANGRSIVVRAIVRNADARLRPGMFARVRLLTSESQESLTIPEQALIPTGDEFYVYKLADNRVQRTRIEIGQRREGVVEVVRGLAKEDKVVTAGQSKVRDGAPVQVAETKPADKVAAPETAPANKTPATSSTPAAANSPAKS
jgi:membrane fusion protein, multidrug efflux system